MYTLLLIVLLFMMLRFYKFNMYIFIVLILIQSPCSFYIWLMAIDQISYLLSVLSLVVGLITAQSILIIASYQTITWFLMALIYSMILFFYSTNLMGFYIMFELSLLPIVLMIYGWGYQIERIQSIYFLFVYMIIFSFPFLFFMMYLTPSLVFYFIPCLNFGSNGFTSTVILLLFLAKSPTFLLHYWLPKAHVEASLVGSMILAGAMLKMGGYGVYRLSTFFNGNLSLIYLFLGLGVVYSTFLCLSQSDLKSLVAYSSVGHMTLVILGILFMSKVTMKGALIMMISHGILSPLLFFSVNMFYYSAFSRSFFSGQIKLKALKVLSMTLFLLLACTLNFPPFLSFWGELLLILGLNFTPMTLLALSFIMIMASCYYSIFFIVNLTYSKVKESANIVDLNLVHSSIFLFSVVVYFLLLIHTISFL